MYYSIKDNIRIANTGSVLKKICFRVTGNLKGKSSDVNNSFCLLVSLQEKLINIHKCAVAHRTLNVNFTNCRLTVAMWTGDKHNHNSVLYSGIVG